MMIDYGTGKLVYGSQPDELTFEYLVETTLWHPVSFIQRNLFSVLGKYDESLKIVADYEFFLKAIIVKGIRARHIPFPISVFNTFGIGSSEKHKVLQNIERTKVQEKYFSKQAIATAWRLIELRKTKAVIISKKLDKVYFLKSFARSIYNSYVSIRNYFLR